MTPDSLTSAADPLAELMWLLQKLQQGRVDVLLALIGLADEGGVYNAGLAQIGKVIGLDENVVRTHLMALSTLGVVRYEGRVRGQKQSRVTILFNEANGAKQCPEGEGDA